MSGDAKLNELLLIYHKLQRKIMIYQDTADEAHLEELEKHIARANELIVARQDTSKFIQTMENYL